MKCIHFRQLLFVCFTFLSAACSSPQKSSPLKENQSLVDAAALRGKVIDQNGHGVADVILEASSLWGLDRQRLPELRASTKTNAQGEFVFDNLRPSNWNFRLIKPGYCSPWFSGNLSPSEIKSGVEATIHKQVSVRGRVSLPQGWDSESFAHFSLSFGAKKSSIKEAELVQAPDFTSIKIKHETFQFQGTVCAGANAVTLFTALPSDYFPVPTDKWETRKVEIPDLGMENLELLFESRQEQIHHNR